MEIERKWLVDPEKIPYDLSQLPSRHIEQAYVSFQPSVRVRNVNSGEKYILTIKRPTQYGGIASEESETAIDEKTYRFLMSNTAGYVIRKTRYIHTLPSGLRQEIDIFEQALKGLAYLEIEFPALEDAQCYVSPDWVECEVTEDPAYKNSALAQNGIPLSAVFRIGNKENKEK